MFRYFACIVSIFLYHLEFGKEYEMALRISIQNHENLNVLDKVKKRQFMNLLSGKVITFVNES